MRHSTGGVDVTLHPVTGLPNYIEDRISREDSGCWVWTGRLSVDGYASVRYKKTLWQAHRLIYYLEVGAFDFKLELDHIYSAKGCPRHCVNPKHLEPVTPAENKRRTGQRRTHCASGHEYTTENTHIAKDSKDRKYKRCRACSVIKSRAYRDKTKALQNKLLVSRDDK